MSTAPAAPARDHRSAVIDAVRALTGARASVQSTGGGCEWLNVGPLDNGAHLTITDGDAGLPSDPVDDAGYMGWLVQRWTGDPYTSEDVNDECDGYPPFVTAQSLTVDGLIDAVRRALSGADER